MVQISFEQGTLLIKGNVRVPNATWDERSGSFRALAIHYMHTTNYLRNSKIQFEDAVLSLLPCPDLAAAYEASGNKLKLRDYQADLSFLGVRMINGAYLSCLREAERPLSEFGL
jgi:hypothetical protein